MFSNVSALPSHVPATLLDLVGVREGQRFRGNCSGADVFRLESPTEGACFLKAMFVAKGRDGAALDGERNRLDWLLTKLAAGATEIGLPRVLGFGESENSAGRWTYLLTTAVPGQPLHKSMDETPIRAGRLMGQTLRALHGVDPSGCPAWRSPDDLLARAEANVAAGRVTSSLLRSTRDPAVAKRLLRKLQSHPPAAFDPVVCHGDFCLPNVLASLDDVCSIIDLGDVSVADRHLDLATGVRSLRYNGGMEDVVKVFFNWYGRDEVDEERLRFYASLCELL